ncbi:MAG: fibronectin type III domain-containing protein, partial [Candidatus Hermodarchaeia archaeon]
DIIGKGHFVMIGYDYYSAEPNFETILANAIRLHRHVVFDDSHANGYEIDMEFWGWREDLRAAGFAVSQMDTFTSDYLNASDVLVIAFANALYTGGEVVIIEEFVAQGGSLFLIGDYSSYAVEVNPIAEEFGFDFELNLVSLNDTDDYIAATPYWVAYEDSNLIAHPITQGVTRVEFYLSNAIVGKPAEAVDVIITDIDGTSFWSNNTAAPGIPVFAALEYQRGRIVIGTDFNLFSSSDDTDGDTDLNYYDSDNDVFAMNTIQWLGENRAPVVTVLAPNGGETYLAGVETIAWTAYDPNNDLIHSYTVSYSPDNGSSWTTIASGLADTSVSWNLTGLLYSPLSLIRVQAMDYGMTGEDISDDVFTVGILELPPFPPIPGFPLEAIALGLLLSLGAIFLVRRRQNNKE